MEEESIDTYCAALKEIAKDCLFEDIAQADIKSIMLRDQLVVGAENQRIREKLLMEGDNLTWETAVTLAKQLESACLENENIQTK